MPRADLLPAFDTEISEVPSTTNPLGMRGGSEGGITPTVEFCGAYHGRLS
jgi:carbon-monoxide dehydrogenase large subunit